MNETNWHNLKKADFTPALADVLRVAKYRKHRVSLVVADSFEISQPYWAGGSKTEYFILHPATGETAGLSVSNATQWPAAPGCETIAMAYGRLYVVGGTFRGKAATWTIWATAQTVKDLGLLANPES